MDFPDIDIVVLGSYYLIIMNTHLRLYAVRGAVCCENTLESLEQRIPQLYREILSRNTIQEEDIVSIVFSVTGDIDILNPATALRRAGFASDTPLFACAEPFVIGGLPQVIRILITYYGSIRPTPVYIHGAEVLRPDLSLVSDSSFELQ